MIMQNANTRRGNTQEITKAVNQNQSHCRGILSGISLIPGHCSDLIKANSLCYNNQEAGDPRLRPSGMTPLFNTPLPRLTAVLSPQGGQKTACGFTARFVTPQGFCAGYSGRVGFTLIELLVVVLIIGILAAVALPQYQKAVKKAQGAEALAAFDAYDKAVSAYYLEHGTYEGITADTLGIQMPVLKDWKYGNANGGPTKYNLLNTFQVGCAYGQSGSLTLYSKLWDNNNGEPIIWGRWQRGKMNIIECENNKCKEYFNCNTWTREIQVCDSPTCPTYSITSCVIK